MTLNQIRKRAGKKSYFRRANWMDGVCIRLAKDGDRPFLYFSNGGKWSPYLDDLFADDWSFVENEVQEVIDNLDHIEQPTYQPAYQPNRVRQYYTTTTEAQPIRPANTILTTNDIEGYTEHVAGEGLNDN